MSAVIVLDLEAVTVPWWSPPPDKPDAFAPSCAWRIVCACALVIGDGVPAMHTFTGDEREILIGLRGLLAGATQIVGFRSRTYDAPVIMARSFVHGVEQPWYYDAEKRYERDPRFRYGNRRAAHLDLYEQLGDFGAMNPGKLDDVARALGLDGKGDTKGSDVAGMYERGELAAIARYCSRDVLVTALAWARWCLLVGDADEVRTAKREAWIRGALESAEVANG